MIGPDTYTERQLKAATLLVEGLTQHAAYKAVYSVGNLKPDAVRAKASAFFRKPKLAALVARLQSESARRCNVTQDRVTRELSAVAFAILPDLVETDGQGMLRMKPLEQLTEAQRRAVKKLKLKTRTTATDDGTTTVQETEVELHGKLEALHLLGQNIGMFKTLVQHEIPALDYRPETVEGRADGGG